MELPYEEAIHSEIAVYAEKVLNPVLAPEESTIRQSFIVTTNRDGLFVTPRFPSGLIMNTDLYFKIFEILSPALYPEYTMVRPPSMQLCGWKDKPLPIARAFFFPWEEGSNTRLIGSLGQVLNLDNHRIHLMNGLDYDPDKAVHTIISGNTGSG